MVVRVTTIPHPSAVTRLATSAHYTHTYNQHCLPILHPSNSDLTFSFERCQHLFRQCSERFKPVVSVLTQNLLQLRAAHTTRNEA
jgi:hypothetical protein